MDHGHTLGLDPKPISATLSSRSTIIPAGAIAALLP